MPEEPLRILAIGAHPDDIEFGCGGILLQETGHGSEIHLCVCSRGEAGSNGTPDEREAEAVAAATMLEAELEFLDLGGDCRIEDRIANRLEMARVIRRIRPDVLLAPVATVDQHPDHTAVGEICRVAARLARYGGFEALETPPHTIGQLLGYAITPSAEPRTGAAVRVDISEVFDRWVALMECHRTQLRTRRYVELQVARARVAGIEAGVEYAQRLFPDGDFLVRGLRALPGSVRLF